MRVDVLSKEYPPEVYGGAGVHVAELVRALRRLPSTEARVHAFGAPRDEPLTSSYADLAELSGANAALRTIGVDLAIADACGGADLVHSGPGRPSSSAAGTPCRRGSSARRTRPRAP
jgi:starch synthase